MVACWVKRAGVSDLEPVDLSEIGATESDLEVPVIGSVFGVLMNNRRDVEHLRGEFSKPPYVKPPMAPILYVKPRNTITLSGNNVCIPKGATEIEIGATIGIVCRHAISGLREEDAAGSILGYVLIADLSIPQKSVFRPPIKARCGDGFCPISDRIVDGREIADIGKIDVAISVNGKRLAANRFDDLLRPFPRLLSEISDFMTLSRGDIIHAGVPVEPLRARPGDRVEVAAQELGSISFDLTSAEAA